MSTAYYIENIERITEQMLEEEILYEINEIRASGIKDINAIRDAAINFIEEKKQSLLQEFLVHRSKEYSMRDLIHLKESGECPLLSSALENLCASHMGINVELNQILHDINEMYELMVNILTYMQSKIEYYIKIVLSDYILFFYNDETYLMSLENMLLDSTEDELLSMDDFIKNIHLNESSNMPLLTSDNDNLMLMSQYYDDNGNIFVKLIDNQIYR